jgi:prefoldin subunit 5
MTENGDTKIRFDLWAVLSFLVVLVGIGMGYLFTAQATAREDRTKAIQIVSDRVTKLEERLEYIKDGINELKGGQKDLIQALYTHERNTMSLIRKSNGFGRDIK